jgi:phage terminase small subunit
MVKPSIRARIDELKAERSKRVGISADRVVQELARIGFIKASDVINMKDATVKADADADDIAAIASVKVKETFGDYPSIEREVKLCDKTKSLELLGRHLGMFKDDINLNVSLPKIVDDIGGGGSG